MPALLFTNLADFCDEKWSNLRRGKFHNIDPGLEFGCSGSCRGSGGEIIVKLVPTSDQVPILPKLQIFGYIHL
jgi:hypothetical protein